MSDNLCMMCQENGVEDGTELCDDCALYYFGIDEVVEDE